MNCLKIPVVEQHESSDCGVACVVSICAHYGKETTISYLRDIMGTDAFGTSINGICKGLAEVGFDHKAIFIGSRSFAKGDFTLPAIARLVRNDGSAHFVAIYTIKDGIVRYMDPAYDKAQKKTVEEFSKDFDGGLILMYPNEKFVKTKKRKKGLINIFKRIVRPHKGLFAMAIIMSVMLTLFGIVSAMFNKILVDDIIPYQKENQLLLYAIVLGLIGLAQI